ncbi:hypothetical protein GOP47_0022960 [Adiantum capillus-veneris]|uniref:Uncharacterized protein n=1 Tax=Adiantum capillus-veneris TaxID=13818 RepID=A0A9D4U6F1_ADICA|nr:hypothetical protein GOP47_0022960 [Adiantum capillus-veneris]
MIYRIADPNDAKESNQMEDIAQEATCCNDAKKGGSDSKHDAKEGGEEDKDGENGDDEQGDIDVNKNGSNSKESPCTSYAKVDKEGSTHNKDKGYLPNGDSDRPQTLEDNAEDYKFKELFDQHESAKDESNLDASKGMVASNPIVDTETLVSENIVYASGRI